MSIFKNKTKYYMNKSDASATLHNIFDACDKPAATKIDDIIANSVKVEPGFNARITFTIILLCITLIIPLLCAPIFNTPDSYYSDRANIQVKIFEVNSQTVTIDFDSHFVDLESVYALNAAGDTIYPYAKNIWKNEVRFHYDDTEWNIYVEDTNGNPLHLLLTPPQ